MIKRHLVHIFLYLKIYTQEGCIKKYCKYKFQRGLEPGAFGKIEVYVDNYDNMKEIVVKKALPGKSKNPILDGRACFGNILHSGKFFFGNILLIE